MATLTNKGLAFSSGETVSSTPFIYNHVDSASYALGGSWTQGPTTPDWQFPAKSKGILYWYFPLRNDSGNWGGGRIRIYYRINSGSWVDLGNSGYGQSDTVMSYNGAGRIDSQCQSLHFNFTSITSNFTCAFRFDCIHHDGNGAMVGSCNCDTGGNNGLTYNYSANGTPSGVGGAYSVSHIAFVGQGYNA